MGLEHEEISSFRDEHSGKRSERKGHRAARHSIVKAEEVESVRV